MEYCVPPRFVLRICSTRVWEAADVFAPVTKAFRNGDPKNGWIWGQPGGEESYEDLRGRVVAQLLAHFKIRNVLSGAGGVRRLALVRILDPVGPGRFHGGSRQIRVSKRPNGRDM